VTIVENQRNLWTVASATALAAHVVVVALILARAHPFEPPLPEPVVLVDMPPEAAAAPSPSIAEPQSRPEPAPAETPPMDVPLTRAPLPADPVVLPAPQPVRAVQPTPMPSAPVAAPPAPPSTTPGSDPRARKQEMDYFALLAAHLNRRKSYPVEARKARQEGVVTVRFTVDRDGNVSDVAIKRSSGHDILDARTLDLVQRVAPMPRMPTTMQRDRISLSLPIEYTLKTN